jgi:hypothetical protein
LSLLSLPFGSSLSRFRRSGAFRQIALGVAFALFVAAPSAAQQGGSGGGGGSGGSGGAGGGALTGTGGSDDGASCMPSTAPECPERCPSFDTCFISAAMGQPARLYYRVPEQRFDCDELDCEQAAVRLNDYCCERGEFAPQQDDDGGGGCVLHSAPGEPSEGSAAWLGMAVGIGALGLARARRRLRQQRR